MKKTEQVAVIACLALFSLLFVLSSSGQAQTAPLPLGSVGTPSLLSHCPAVFYGGPLSNPTACYQTTITGCPADPIVLTFSYITPASPIGTIVLFNGGGGEMTMGDNNSGAAADYYNANYAVVQTSWSTDWEDTNEGSVNQYPAPSYNILNAACRPATFLNYIANLNIQFRAANTAVCAQGTSAGSGAVAYSAVWYGLGSSLNNIELNVGPVFGDIEIGCQYPAVGNVGICQGGQPYCSAGTLLEASSPGGWSVPPQYIGNYKTSVQTWTGNLSPGCNNGSTSTGGTGPLTGNNQTWKLQSIVTGTGGAFSWPTNLQGLGGWACYNYQPGTCTGALYCPNNSGPEGEQFYLAVNSAGAPPNAYLVTGIQSCNGAEGDTAGSIDPDNVSLTGEQAVEQHMTQNCHLPQP